MNFVLYRNTLIRTTDRDLFITTRFLEQNEEWKVWVGADLICFDDSECRFVVYVDMLDFHEKLIHSLQEGVI